MKKVIHNTKNYLLALSLLGLLLISVPLTSQAQSTAVNNDALIVQLQQMIQDLMKQLTTLQQEGKQVAKFAEGEAVITTENLLARDTPSSAGAIVDRIPAGRGGVVLDGPISAGVYQWYKVEYNNGVIGWSAGNWLARDEVGDVNPVKLYPRIKSLTVDVNTVKVEFEFDPSVPVTPVCGTFSSPATIDWGDGTTTDVLRYYGCGEKRENIHTYLESGTYKVMIKNEKGMVLSSQSVTVKALSVTEVSDKPFIAKLEVENMTVNATVQFGKQIKDRLLPKGMYETCGSTPTQYSIDWGDGSNSESLLKFGCRSTNDTVADHVYTISGFYKVTVKDVSGDILSSRSVQVNMPEQHGGKISLITEEKSPVVSGLASSNAQVNIVVFALKDGLVGDDSIVKLYSSKNIPVDHKGVWSYEITDSIFIYNNLYRIDLYVNNKKIDDRKFTYKYTSENVGADDRALWPKFISKTINQSDAGTAVVNYVFEVTPARDTWISANPDVSIQQMFNLPKGANITMSPVVVIGVTKNGECNYRVLKNQTRKIQLSVVFEDLDTAQSGTITGGLQSFTYGHASNNASTYATTFSENYAVNIPVNGVPDQPFLQGLVVSKIDNQMYEDMRIALEQLKQYLAR